MHLVFNSPYCRKFLFKLPSTTPVLQSTTLYYKVLLQYYSVLQTYYSSTTPYYKVLLQYYSLLQSTTLYYKVLLRPKRRQNDVHPVVLRTTKYYSSTTSYYKVLPRTTKYYSSTTPYYKRTTKYYSSTTPYYDVLLQYYSVLQTYYSVLQSLLRPKRRQNDVHPVLLRTTKYYSVLQTYYSSTTPVLLRTTKYHSVLQSTTPTETTSERRPSSTTPYYKVLLQYYSVLQTYYKVLLQYYSLLQSTALYYKVLLRPKRRQNDVHPVLLRTTKYYSSTTSYYKVLLQYYYSSTTSYYKVLQSTTPVLLRTTKYYSNTTPYYKVLCTTKYYFDRNDVRTTSIQYYSVLQSTIYSFVLQSTTPYYKVLLQYYSVLQSTTPVLLRTTNVLLRAKEYYSSTTPYYKVVQKLPKRAFRARLPQLFKEQASKTSISCEASSTFQRTSFQNKHFVRDFRNFSSDKLPKRAFRARLPQLFKEQASKTSISCEASSTFQSRSFQSLAPATQNAKMTSHLESLKRQNERFVRDFLQISHFQLENRRFRASFSHKAIFTELKKYDFCLRSFRHFSRQSPNPAPATIFAVVSRLRVPAIAIRGNSTFATSQNAAPATTSRKATSQSAAPATKKRHACIDTLPKYCACHAKHENNLTFCDLEAPKRAFRARLPPLFTL